MRRRDDTLAELAYARATAAVALANGTASAIKQPTWFIDPQNSSGKASPTNDGLTALTPITSFSVLFARWGTNAPLITGSTVTVTLMSDALIDGSDPVDLRPYLTDGGGFILQGVPRQVASGTFGVVTPQNRATGQRTTATAAGKSANFWTPLVQMLVHDTTADAWFWVMNDLGTATALFTRPVSVYANDGSLPDLLNITNGDAFVVYDLPKIDLGRFEVNQDTYEATNPFVFYPATAQYIAASTSPLNLQPQNVDVGGGAPSFAQCRLTSRQPNLLPGQTFLVNSFSGGPLSTGGAGYCAAIAGTIAAAGGLNEALFQSGTLILDGDVYADDLVRASNCQVIVGLAYCHSRHAPPGRIRASDGRDSGQAGAGSTLLVAPYFYGSVALWGPTSVEAVGGTVVYQGLAVACFLNTGGMQIDGSSTAMSATAAGVWNGPIAITPANLDAVAGAAGFGGCAYGVRGSKIRQWF